MIEADRWIPKRYHFGVSKQIAVRLPDDIVDFIDQLVDSGQASSRAVVVARAFERSDGERSPLVTRPSWPVRYQS